VLAITLEQKGGSPTGKAQGPIVAVGKAMPI
jgi:anti-sigma-K factor RskA